MDVNVDPINGGDILFDGSENHNDLLLFQIVSGTDLLYACSNAAYGGNNLLQDDGIVILHLSASDSKLIPAEGAEYRLSKIIAPGKSVIIESGRIVPESAMEETTQEETQNFQTSPDTDDQDNISEEL